MLYLNVNNIVHFDSLTFYFYISKRTDGGIHVEIHTKLYRPGERADESHKGAMDLLAKFKPQRSYNSIFVFTSFLAVSHTHFPSLASEFED
jgi:hypothetical protein